jgi:hypothetical protein
MRKVGWIGLLLCFFQMGWSQEDTTHHAADTIRRKGFSLSLNSEIHLLGNALNSEFYRTFTRGGHWSTEQNNRVMNNLGFSNLSFLSMTSSLDFTELASSSSKASSIYWKFNVSDHYYGHARFSGDLYRLATNGNANYLNDTLHIGSNQLQGLHYRSFGVGISQNSGLDYVMMSYVDGLDYYGLTSQPGIFFTSANGDTITVKSEFKQWRNQGNRKGVGFKLDFQKSFIGRKYKVYFQLKDLGWVKWNQLEKSVWKLDDTYTGIQWMDWIKLDQPIDSSLNQWTDVKTSLKDKWIALPTSLAMQSHWQVLKNWELGYSFRRWVYQEHQGYRAIHVQHTWDRYSMTRPNLTIGGQLYQSFMHQYWLGADATWTWNNGMSFHLQTFNLASPWLKVSKQMGFGFSFQYVFGSDISHQNLPPIEKNNNEPNEYFQF